MIASILLSIAAKSIWKRDSDHETNKWQRYV